MTSFQMANKMLFILVALRQLMAVMFMQANIPGWCRGTAVQSHVKPRLPRICLTNYIATAFQNLSVIASL